MLRFVDTTPLIYISFPIGFFLSFAVSSCAACSEEMPRSFVLWTLFVVAASAQLIPESPRTNSLRTSSSRNPPLHQARFYGTSRKEHLLEAISHIVKAGSLRESEVLRSAFRSFRPMKPQKPILSDITPKKIPAVDAPPIRDLIENPVKSTDVIEVIVDGLKQDVHHEILDTKSKLKQNKKIVNSESPTSTPAAIGIKNGGTEADPRASIRAMLQAEVERLKTPKPEPSPGDVLKGMIQHLTASLGKLVGAIDDADSNGELE